MNAMARPSRVACGRDNEKANSLSCERDNEKAKAYPADKIIPSSSAIRTHAVKA